MKSNFLSLHVQHKNVCSNFFCLLYQECQFYFLSNYVAVFTGIKMPKNTPQRKQSPPLDQLWTFLCFDDSLSKQSQYIRLKKYDALLSNHLFPTASLPSYILLLIPLRNHWLLLAHRKKISRGKNNLGCNKSLQFCNSTDLNEAINKDWLEKERNRKLYAAFEHEK